MRLLLISTLYLLLSCSENPVQNIPDNSGEHNLLKSYYFDYDSTSPELPMELIDTTSSYNIKISRETRYEVYKTLIEKAEAFYPPADSLYSKYFTPDSSNKQRLWWYDQFDGIRLPYTITKASINYYINLILYYQKSEFDSAGTISNISASFSYKATVNFYSSLIIENREYQGVKIVEQEINWSNYCGLLCGLWFTKKRIVIFDSNENIIAVIGDGQALVLVS